MPAVAALILIYRENGKDGVVALLKRTYDFRNGEGGYPGAGAGEVLVSGTVRDLVAGSGIAFEEWGEATLKGVSGVWRLFSASTSQDRQSV